MKKFLFTLVALLTAGSAFATNEYWYMDPIELTAEDVANGATVVRPINAHFEAYVSSFMVTFTLPEGVTVTKAVRKDGLFIDYFTEDGEEDTYKPSLGKNTEMTKFIVSTFTELGYTEDGECYGVLKWGPGEYQNMWEMTFQFPAGFEGGQIGILSEPSVSGDLDNRPEFIPTDGKESTHYFDVTVPEGPQPEPAPEPTFVWSEESFTMEAVCENHEVTLMIGEEVVSNPYTVEQTYEDQEITFTAFTVANADEDANSAAVHNTVMVPAKAKTPSQKPVVNVDVTDTEVIITATGSGEVKLYVNGEEIAQPVRIDRPEYGQQPLEYVAKASNLDSDPTGQIQYELTWSDEVEVTVPVKEPVWQDVAAPVITTSQDDDNVYVHVEWPTTTGGKKYSGQDSYARGEQDYDVTVEAYTEENYPYRESEHATLTITVPAKEVVPAVLEGEIVFGEVNQENGQFTVTYTGSEDVTITLSDESILPVRDASKTYQLPAYGTYDVTATVSATGFESSSKVATLVWEAPATETTTFVKVTSADQLVAGKKYIIVAGNKAMGVAATGNFLTAIDITGGDEVEVGNDVAIMTLGGTLGHYTLALDDKYLHAVNSTSLDFGNSTEWAISDYNGTLAGYRVKHADYNRSVRYASGYNRFGNYSNSDQNSEYGWIYVEKSETPVLQDLAGTIEFGVPTADGKVSVTYNGNEAGVVVTVEGYDVVDGMIQLPEYGTYTLNATATADGYNPLNVEGTVTWSAPVLPTLGGYFVWGVLDEEGHFTVTYNNFDYDGPYTLVVKDENGNVMNPEVGDAGEYYQAAEGTHTYTVEVTAPGYQVKTDTHEYTYTVPTYAPAPILSWNEETFTMTAYLDNREYTNDDIELYMNNEKVENPKTVAQTYQPQALEFKARTIGKDGDENSEWVYKNVTVPAKEKTASAEPTISVVEGADAYVITGQGTGTVVMYDAEGNEIANPYTVERTNETQIIIITVENTDADTEDVMYKPTSKTFTVTVPAKEEVVAPAAPEITVNTFDDYVTLGASDVEGATVVFYQCDDETGANPREIENPTNFNRETENYDVYVYAVATNAAGETSSVVTKVVIPAKVVTPPDPTSINEMNGGKAVAGVRYFNMAGQEMQEANGMTIVVTTYTDGTTSAVKVMK